jgi:tRNA (mo5U34)-methyltransferase
VGTAGEQQSIERRIVDARWYHTLELPGGLLTEGEYDLRPVVSRLPIPARLDGLRCIDIGSRDGFYAFEMERRGAEVVSVDIEDPAHVHFPGRRFDEGVVQRELEDGNRAFRLAREAIGSRVERRHVSIYDLDPVQLGSFDFGVIGTLLLHLRDPVSALAAVRRVIAGRLLLNEPVIPEVHASVRRRAIAEPLMVGGPFWWRCNPAGLRHLLGAAGFDVLKTGRPYVVPFGSGHTAPRLISELHRPLVEVPRRLIERRGHLHCWVLAKPAGDRQGTNRA